MHYKHSSTVMLAQCLKMHVDSIGKACMGILYQIQTKHVKMQIIKESSIYL